MHIHVAKDSEVPLHEQVAAQLVFLIGTGRLKPGTFLPSVRALSQHLRIHRNTISRAYQDLTLNKLVEKRTGRRLAIRASGLDAPQGQDLDALIVGVVTESRRLGYSLQQLQDRLRERLLAAPPDHLLVLSDDLGMRTLLPHELSQHFPCRVDACTPEQLLAKPDRAIGAVVVSPQGHIPKVRSVISPERPPVPIRYSAADEHLRAIQHLSEPSLIAVVSVSRYFLEMARGLLAPVVGRRHGLRTCLMSGGRSPRFGVGDYVICDFVTYPVVRAQSKPGRVFVHKVISHACIETISSRMI